MGMVSHGKGERESVELNPGRDQLVRGRKHGRHLNHRAFCSIEVERS